MKRGRLKSVDLPIPVDEITSSVSQRTLDGEHEWALTVQQRDQTTSGHSFARGRAALRKEIERDIAHVNEHDNGVSIRPSTRYSHTTEYGEWLAIDDGWLIVSDEWVAGVVGTQISGYPTDASLRLQELLEEFDSPSVWQMGFAGRTVAEGGSKGVLYGNEVNHDPDLAEDLRHTPLSELGVEHIHESIPVKSYFAADTGYIEVYGSDFTSYQFVDYCCRWVADHVTDEDETSTDESESHEESEEAGEGEVLQCENCPRESDSVQKTVVDDGSVMELCVTCRNYYYENGEVPA